MNIFRIRNDQVLQLYWLLKQSAFYSLIKYTSIKYCFTLRCGWRLDICLMKILFFHNHPKKMHSSMRITPCTQVFGSVHGHGQCGWNLVHDYIYVQGRFRLSMNIPQCILIWETGLIWKVHILTQSPPWSTSLKQ